MFLLFGRGACSFFCCLSGGRVFVWLFGQGRVCFFAVWAGYVFILFAVWAGGVLFFPVWAGDGISLTYRSAWLVSKRPNNKKDQTAKKNTGSYKRIDFSVQSPGFSAFRRDPG